MFIGHIAVGFAAKRAAPKATLGILVAAALLLDLIWPLFVLAGWERVAIDHGNTAFTPLAFVYYPISHSLAGAAAWALLFAGGYWAATSYRRGAIVIGLAVLSHWWMDVVVHRPDLPLYPGSKTYAGLGLWNSVAGTIAVEATIFAAGVWLYAAVTKARNRIGEFAFWSLVLFTLAVYSANASGGPLPPSSQAVALVSLAQWLFIPWAAWCDRYRVQRSSVVEA